MIVFNCFFFSSKTLLFTTGHVAAYMKLLQANDELYKKRFSKFIAAGLNGDNLEAL
jgi:hypothetical protein